MHPFRVLTPLFFALVFVPLAANAQSRAQRDSLKQVVIGQRLRMHAMDSIGDPRGSIMARMELAPLVGAAERLRLLEDAAAGAQSAALLEEEILARKQLVEAYASAGKHARALKEAAYVTVLVEARSEEQRLRSIAREDSQRAELVAKRDSSEAAWNEELRKARHRESHMEATAEQWLFCLIGVVLVAFVVIIFILLRSSGRVKRFRSEVQALRAEVAELRKPRNTYRPADAAQASAPAPIAPVEVAPAPLRLPDDALAAGMFLRSAPERLSTFKEARARGDFEKAVRVVHTLKPLLASVDADRFAPLCARLVAPDAAGGDTWNADADTLSSMIEVLLQQR
ncbi:MAG: Hpt domain-containing protein [Flavobacteriales bacterium]|nr:Hpt domain-containing protein [Flavobacteriales bacterium]